MTAPPLERLGIASTGRPGMEYPEMGEDGMPVNRTTCPHCLALDGVRQQCPTCGGEPVCPTCRNGHVMRMGGERVQYRVCPDCCIATNEYTITGVPIWVTNPSGKRAAIERYRRERVTAILNVEDDDDVPS